MKLLTLCIKPRQIQCKFYLAKHIKYFACIFFQFSKKLGLLKLNDKEATLFVETTTPNYENEVPQNIEREKSFKKEEKDEKFIEKDLSETNEY